MSEPGSKLYLSASYRHCWSWQWVTATDMQSVLPLLSPQFQVDGQDCLVTSRRSGRPCLHFLITHAVRGFLLEACLAWSGLTFRLVEATSNPVFAEPRLEGIQRAGASARHHEFRSKQRHPGRQIAENHVSFPLI